MKKGIIIANGIVFGIMLMSTGCSQSFETVPVVPAETRYDNLVVDVSDEDITSITSDYVTEGTKRVIQYELLDVNTEVIVTSAAVSSKVITEAVTEAVTEVVTTVEPATEEFITTVESVATETERITEAEITTEEEFVEIPEEVVIVDNSVTKRNQRLAEYMESAVKTEQEYYPNEVIAIGIYDANTFEPMYELNTDRKMAAGCTIKASYADFVLSVCRNSDINIWSYSIEYKWEHKNNGSGVIKYADYGTEYTVAELISLLLGESDNTAYNMLLSKFTLQSFQKYLNTFGGQELMGCRYGYTTVEAKKNEWKKILENIDAELKYTEFLESKLTNSKYCYIAQGMDGWYDYLHKSGWSDESTDYTCANDCAIINGVAIMIFTSDKATGTAHHDSVKRIAANVEKALF